MSNDTPTWEDEIEGYFTLPEAGCMANEHTIPPLDLNDYNSVKNYIEYSNANKEKLLNYLETGHMPQGGEKWDDDKLNRFKAWIEAKFPKSKADLK